MNLVNLLVYSEISNPDYKAILMATKGRDVVMFEDAIMNFFDTHLKSEIPSKIEFDEERDAYVVSRLDPTHPIGEFALLTVKW